MSNVPLLLGVAILIGIFIFLIMRKRTDTQEFLSTSLNESSLLNVAPGVLSSDIVLSSLHSRVNGKEETDYSLLFNCDEGLTIPYTIENDGKVVAQGSLTSKSKLYKIKGLPLERGKIYNVTVGSTKVQINFQPPQIINRSHNEGKLIIGTSVVPTDAEVIHKGIKVPLDKCGITVEPPGLSCEIDKPSEEGELIIMLYNGTGCTDITQI